MPLTKQTKKFKNTMTRLVVLPMGLILIAAVILCGMVFNLLSVLRMQQHSYEVISMAVTIQKLMSDAETGLRGYMLNKDLIYLEPYNRALPIIPSSIKELENLVSDNTEQAKRVDSLRNKWGVWQELSIIRVKRPTFLIIPDESLTGKNLMDSIRGIFTDFLKVEENLQAERVDNVRIMQKKVILGGGIVGVGLAVFISFYIFIEVRHLTGDYKKALTDAYNRNLELAEQKEWFHVTLSSIGDAVIVTDKNGIITFMNHESQRMTGWTIEEASTQNITTVFHIINEDTRAIVEDPIQKVLRENKVVGLANHTLLISKNGKEWPIEDSAAPIHAHDGSIQGVVLVFHDASALRIAHRMLQDYSAELAKQVEERTHSLRHAVEEMEAFSYTVSHDLRSPLRAMQGYAQSLIEDYAGNLDENGILYLNRINNAAQRLDKLIQDLLAYTRLSRDRSAIIQVNLDELVRQMLAQYPQFQLPNASIEVVGHLLPVLAREASLTQILSNLIDNAIKFVAPRTIPSIKIWSENNGENVRINIKDNGIGIASEDIERIFKIFEQIHSQKEYGGTGIGLAIVKRAVENLGGRLGVDSKINEGSLFWIELKKASAS